MDVYARLLKAYKVGVPLVSIDTADPFASTDRIMATFREHNAAAPKEEVVRLISWNCAAGVRPLTKESQAALSKIEKPEVLLHPTMMAQRLQALEPCSVVICWNMHRHLTGIDTVQAISNLREAFKENGRMLIMLGTNFKTPIELQHDVYPLVEALPSQVQLAATIREMVEGTNYTLDESTLSQAAAAAIGLTTFACENLAAMAIDKDQGLQVNQLWESKRRKIDQTPGLRVVSGCRYSDIGGLHQAKKLLGRVATGNQAPRAIIHIDEIEKALAGAAGDNSGVTQDQLGTLLTYMQEHMATGAILSGVPGSGKSRIAVATGAEANIPVIQLDLGGLKGSLVGKSEDQLREALRVISAVSGDSTLWLATANSLATIPNELRRRFKLGVMFFDLPTREERQKIWELYAVKFELSREAWLPLLDHEWTGAEIEACCDLSWRMDSSLEEAAEFVNPIGVSARETLEALRDNANGRYMSASAPGLYKKDQDTKEARRRRLD